MICSDPATLESVARQGSTHHTELGASFPHNRILMEILQEIFITRPGALYSDANEYARHVDRSAIENHS